MKGNLKVAHINVQSIFTGFNDLKELVGSNGIDVLALSETWLSHDHSRDAFNIPGYTLKRKDRLGRGRGVPFYVCTKYKPERIDVKCEESSIEQLWIKVRFGIKVVAFAVFYLRWLKMRNRMNLHYAVFIYRVMITSVPSYLKSKLILKSSVNNRVSRHSMLLTIPRHDIALFRRGFAYQAAHIYNKLPEHAAALTGSYSIHLL